MASKYTARGTITTVLSTELNSLASATACSASSAQANKGSGKRDNLAQFEIYIAAQGTNRAAGASISLYIIPEVDGTNYASITDECLNNYFAGSVSVDDGATAARYLVMEAKLPPSDWKAILYNGTGQAFASSGNTVKYRTFGYEDVT